ncbi:MAG: methionyl-tRNA formyltransferase, partial [Chlamydiota bacterium]
GAIMKPKVIFFGTPHFAAQVLDYLLQHNVDIAAVVTRVDKPKGRSGTPTPPPVKQLLLESYPSIPLYQPLKASDPKFAETLKTYQADLFVFVAYGEIVRENLLEMPKLACINLHASILPKYRGAAPIQRAIIEGETESGVTIMHMVKELDAGNMIKVSKTPINTEMTSGELQERLSEIGQPALLEVIEDFGKGPVKDIPQDHQQVTFAPKVTPKDARISWDQPATKLYNLYRGVTPRPGAWSQIKIRGKAKRLKILQAELVNDRSGSPGKILESSSKGLMLACSSGALNLTKVQLEGKKPMAIAEFLQGFPTNLLDFTSNS